MHARIICYPNDVFRHTKTKNPNITCHTEEFGVKSPGKSACDVVGGTLERLAEKANLH
jgi:hypothetical protein